MILDEHCFFFMSGANKHIVGDLGLLLIEIVFLVLSRPEASRNASSVNASHQLLTVITRPVQSAQKVGVTKHGVRPDAQWDCEQLDSAQTGKIASAQADAGTSILTLV